MNMEFIQNLCDDDIDTSNQNVCVENAVKNIKEVYIHGWREQIHDICPILSLDNDKIVCIVSLIQDMTEYMGITDHVTPYEHLTDIFQGLDGGTKKLKFNDPVLPLVDLEDIVGSIMKISKKRLIHILECMQQKDTLQGMLQDLVMKIVQGVPPENEEKTETEESDESGEEDDESGEEDDEKHQLMETIQRAIDRIRLDDVLRFEVEMNVNTTRKGDPHNIIFYWKDEEKRIITGKKSFRNYIKNFANKMYTEDAERIVMKMSNDFGPVVDEKTVPWVIAVCYIIQRSEMMKKLFLTMRVPSCRISSDVCERIPKRTIGDVVKMFSKFYEKDEEFEELIQRIRDALRKKKPVSSGRVLFETIYQVIWGESVTRKKVVDTDIPTQTSVKQDVPSTSRGKPQSPKKVSRKKTAEEDAKKTPKKRGRPKKNVQSEPQPSPRKKSKSSATEKETSKTRNGILENAAMTLSQLREERDTLIMPGSIIRSSGGKEITIDMFTDLANAISILYGERMEDLVDKIIVSTLLHDGTEYDDVLYIVCTKLCECFASDTPSTATMVIDGVTRTNNVHETDIVMYFIETMGQRRIHDLLKMFSKNIHDKLETHGSPEW